ncbi:MAG: hypothetical protein JXB47_13515 [Anaerolineae bacterium]|nr:hypothetical protein [Anaerolineae bacterium]
MSGFVAFWLAAAALGMATPPASAQDNLLTNGSMEGQYSAQDGIPQLQMPSGWRAWWVQGGGAYDWANVRPEWSTSEASSGYTERVKDGNRAMRYFKGYATFIAGAYQTVSVAAGTPLEFTAWGQAWSCVKFADCNEPRSGLPPRVWSTSNAQGIHLKIGIDPYGGTDPMSGNIVWSGETSALDQYIQFRVTATAAADKVTVFLYATQDWPAENQDAYWDAAVLRTTDGSTGGGAAPASNWVGVAEVATYEPQADGKIIHTVRSGETLGGIAYAYGLPDATTLCAQNPQLPPGCRIIRAGDQLYIGEVEGAGTDEAEGAGEGEASAAGETGAAVIDTGAGADGPVVTGDAAPPSEPGQASDRAGDGGSAPPLSPAATPTPMPTTGMICTSLFEDANENGMHDSDEVMLSGGEIVLLRDGQSAGRYTPDGGPPRCFGQLAPGMYTVSATAPEGYGFTRSPQLAVNVTAGAEHNVAFGAARGVAAASAGGDVGASAEQGAADAVAPDVTGAPATGGFGDFLSRWAGLIVLGLCVVAVMFWVMWRLVRSR